MANNNFIPWEQLFEETVGVYGLINESDEIDIGIPIDEALDPEVAEAMRELGVMMKWVKYTGSGDKDYKIEYDLYLYIVFQAE